MKTRTRTLPALGLLAVMLPGGTAAAAPKAKITLEKAESIALARVPGGVVEESERELENGRLVYEIEVRAPDGREHDFTIDASDGKIIAEEIDD